jgi:hypothetical protein
MCEEVVRDLGSRDTRRVRKGERLAVALKEWMELRGGDWGRRGGRGEEARRWRRCGIEIGSRWRFDLRVE